MGICIYIYDVYIYIIGYIPTPLAVNKMVTTSEDRIYTIYMRFDDVSCLDFCSIALLDL